MLASGQPGAGLLGGGVGPFGSGQRMVALGQQLVDAVVGIVDQFLQSPPGGGRLVQRRPELRSGRGRGLQGLGQIPGFILRPAASQPQSGESLARARDQGPCFAGVVLGSGPGRLDRRQPPPGAALGPLISHLLGGRRPGLFRHLEFLRPSPPGESATGTAAAR